MSSVREALIAARTEGRAALVAYLPAWFPARGEDVAVIRAMVEAGVDIVEVGLPYSDPLMDGPAIQAAVTDALGAGVRTGDVLDTVQGVADIAPTLVMSYWNPIERWGIERFAADLATAGGAGVITPDLPPEEAGPWRAACAATALETVFLAAPSSTDDRLVAISRASSGFVYAASTMGVTGARASVSAGTRTLVDRIRRVTSLPVCVGLGVSTREQAAQIAQYADGVIVGSAFINAVRSAPAGAAVAAAATLAAELAAGVRGG